MVIIILVTIDEPQFREVYCADCKIVLAKYYIKYFTDADINELIHVHYSAHIKEGHAIEIRASM
jgi:hypothetical protein